MRSKSLKKGAALLVLPFLWLVHPGDGRAEGAGGKISLAGTRVVDKGEVFRIHPGAEVFVEGSLTVKGKLSIEGDKESPVTIHLKNEKGYGIVIRGGTLEGRHFSISGAARGIESYSGTVKMSNGNITFPGIHVNAAGGTALDMEEIRFLGGKAGIVFRSGSRGDVKSCRFTGQERAGIYISGNGGATIRNSLFSGAKKGIVLSLFGASAKIEGNRFEGNDEGIRVEKFASPDIVGNEIYRNRYGILFTKRGMGNVTGNVFDGNDVSVYIRYSSYPRFRANDFFGFGRYAVMLDNQSSEWEKAASLSDREERFAPDPEQGKGRIDPAVPTMETLKLPEETLTGKLDFRENYWGPLAREIEEKGPGGNISGIYDGRDTPEFVYREKKYLMDIVDYDTHRLRPSSEVVE